MKILMLIATLLDSLVTNTLFMMGFYSLYLGTVFEGCALISTGVFWQRFEKASLLKTLQRNDGAK